MPYSYYLVKCCENPQKALKRFYLYAIKPTFTSMRFILSYSWAFLWSICMLYLMLKSPGSTPIPLFEGFDKLAHCGCFFLLTALFLYGAVAYTKGMARKYLSAFWVLLGTGAFAFFTEFAQYYFTSTRQADWWDIFADFVGIGMALFAYLLFYRKRF